MYSDDFLNPYRFINFKIIVENIRFFLGSIYHLFWLIEKSISSSGWPPTCSMAETGLDSLLLPPSVRITGVLHHAFTRK